MRHVFSYVPGGYNKLLCTCGFVCEVLQSNLESKIRQIEHILEAENLGLIADVK